MSSIEEVIDKIMSDEKKRDLILSKVTDPDLFIIDAISKGYMHIVFALIDRVRPSTMFECLGRVPDCHFYSLLHKVNESLIDNSDLVYNPLINAVSDLRSCIAKIPKHEIEDCDMIKL